MTETSDIIGYYEIRLFFTYGHFMCWNTCIVYVGKWSYC